MNSKPIKRILSSFSSLIPIEKLVSSNRHSLILPFWHSVSDTPLPHLSQLYQVPTIKVFEQTLDFFLLKYKPALADDVLKYSKTRIVPDKKLFFPSFDDGLSECYHVIAPILKRKGVQAAFFINPSFVDNKMLFHRLKASLILNHIKDRKFHSELWRKAEQLLQDSTNTPLLPFLQKACFTDHPLLDQIAEVIDIDFATYLNKNQPYMTLQQIKELQDEGFLIGAHGMDHREFFLSSEDEIMQQIIESLEFLVRKINPPINTFAFPFTDFKVPDSVFEKVNHAGLWDISFGTAGIKDETMRNHLQRIPMESDKLLKGKDLIRNEYMWYYLKSVIGKNKVSRW